MTRALTFALVALAGVAHARPAPGKAAEKAAAPAADKRRIVGVLDVRVDGVPKEIAAQFQTDLEKQLDSRAYWLAPKSRLLELMSNSTKWTDGCLVGSCLLEVKVQTGADVVLLAALNGSGTSFGYVVTVVRTDTGRVVSQQSERCDVCTVNEALTNATLAAVHLLTALPDKLPDEAAGQRAAMQHETGKLEKLVDQHHAAREHHTTAGLVTLLGGLAIAGAGVAVYFSRDHADYGLATAAAGGGLALGGVVALTF